MTSDAFQAWVGRTEQAEDVASVAPLQGLAATLDHQEPPWRPKEVPPLGHWLYFLPRALQRDIASDGHPNRGGFLPPVPLPRRMWAAGWLNFHAPILIGQTLTRHSSITSIEQKAGRSGPLVFVTVLHEITTVSGPAVSESQVLVYRDAPAPPKIIDPAPREAQQPQADWLRVVTPDPALLFRFSALTFNAHRIHYDRPYSREVEGYPGLVVHGPLIATLMMDLFLRHNRGARVTAFSFKARQPIFDTDSFLVCGKGWDAAADLWALNNRGEIAMTAEVQTAR